MFCFKPSKVLIGKYLYLHFYTLTIPSYIRNELSNVAWVDEVTWSSSTETYGWLSAMQRYSLIFFCCMHSLTTVPIHISVWNFGFGSGLGVNSFEVGRFIPVTCLGLLLTVTWLRLWALEVKVY